MSYYDLHMTIQYYGYMKIPVTFVDFDPTFLFFESNKQVSSEATLQ